MKLTIPPVGSIGIDTIIRLDAAKCAALRQAGVAFAVRYLTSVTVDERDAIINAGLALSLVTYANSWDPRDELAALARLQVPAGAVVWLDCEGVKLSLAGLVQSINAWATAIKAAGYIPGIYVGAGALMSSRELYELAVERYWHSCSRVVDLDGKEAAPACGWAMHQLHPPNLTMGGVLVDINVVQQDYRGRSVAMVAA